jgi:hypothetical protein
MFIDMPTSFVSEVLKGVLRDRIDKLMPWQEMPQPAIDSDEPGSAYISDRNS